MENQATKRKLSFEEMSNAMQGLSEDDLQKILFLVISSVDLKLYESLIMNSVQMKKKLQSVLMQYDLDFLLETLYLIKKYSFLKKFDRCKHQSDLHNRGRISKFRKFLFSICEELADDDVSYITKELNLGPNWLASAECLMCRLLEKKMISSQSLESLRNVFQKQATRYGDVLRKFVRYGPDSEEELMVYPVKFGVAVIVNQVKFIKFKKREGSNVDRDKLAGVLEKFGFKVMHHENLKACEIQGLFDNLAQRTYEYPCVFVACILSHGNEGDVIFGSDDKPVVVSSLVDKMANDCRSLYEMPKLFFIQACKGEFVQEGLVLDSPNSNSYSYAVDNYDSDAQRYIPRLCDTFVAYATVEGFASLRSEEKGSIFVQKLTKYLDKFGEKEDIDVIMKRVTNSVAAMDPKVRANPGAHGEPKLSKQMPEYRSTLRGILKFKKPLTR